MLPGFAVLLLLALWMSVFYQIGIERNSTRNEAVAHSQSLARTLADYTSHILRQTDHATQLFKLKFEETGGHLRLDEFTRRSGLLDSVLPAKLNLPIAVFDQNGKRTDSVHGFVDTDVSNMPYFETHASGGEEPLFRTPVSEPRTHKWQIQVSRRLEDRQGRFAGVIVILVDPTLFIDDYDRLNLDEEGAMILMNPQARLSIGRVGEHMFISDSVEFAGTGADPANEGAGELRAVKSIDAVARVYSAREMSRYGLTAVVGITERMAMAKYQRHRLIYLSAAALASLLIVGVIALQMRQGQRLRASMRAARDAQEILRAAANGSLDGFVLLKAWPGGLNPVQDFTIIDINRRGADLTGIARDELLGQKLCEKLPVSRSAGFYDRYVQVMYSGTPLEEEFEIHRDSSGPHWLHHQIVPIADGVAITVRDITERKHNELEVRNSRSFLQSLIDHLPVLVYVRKVDAPASAAPMVWNHAAESITGFGAAEVAGNTEVAAFTAAFDANHDGPVLHDLPEIPVQRPDGTQRYLHAVTVPLFDEAGHPEYMLCIAEDITVRHQQELALRKSQAELATVNDSSPLGLMRSDRRGECTYVNRTLAAITGLSRAQALGRGWMAALHPDDRPLVDVARIHLSSGNDTFQGVMRCLHPDGKVIWTSVKVAAIRIDGKIEGYVGSVDDITTLREAELALRESEARLRTIANALPAMVAFLDEHQVYRFSNQAYEREFGRSDSSLQGKTVREAVGETRYAALGPYIARALAGEALTFEEDDIHNGAERTIEVNYIPQRSESGVIIGCHVMRQDITSQKREKKHLIKLAQVDALTGLTNRAGFLERLDMAMEESSRLGKLIAIMYMDIDRFKPVNDTYGHNVGDALLKAFSGRLTHALRATDTVARLGGDEFTIIMENLHGPDDATAIAAKIVSVMQAPFNLDGLVVSVSASVGVAYYHGEQLTPEALLKRADVQLYQAKQAGRNTFRVAA